MIYQPNQDYYGDKDIQECELIQSIVRFITNNKDNFHDRLDYMIIDLKAATVLWKR